jgi:hypothetical protein
MISNREHNVEDKLIRQILIYDDMEQYNKLNITIDQLLNSINVYESNNKSLLKIAKYNMGKIFNTLLEDKDINYNLIYNLIRLYGKDNMKQLLIDDIIISNFDKINMNQYEMDNIFRILIKYNNWSSINKLHMKGLRYDDLLDIIPLSKVKQYMKYEYDFNNNILNILIRDHINYIHFEGLTRYHNKLSDPHSHNKLIKLFECHNMNVIKYLHSKGYILNQNTLDIACNHLNLETVKYILDNTYLTLSKSNIISILGLTCHTKRGSQLLWIIRNLFRGVICNIDGIKILGYYNVSQFYNNISSNTYDINTLISILNKNNNLIIKVCGIILLKLHILGGNIRLVKYIIDNYNIDINFYTTCLITGIS